MNIGPEHIKSTKRIGSLHGRPVLAVTSTGGLHMVVVAKSSGTEIIGSGPHAAVARFIAEKKEKDLKLFELSKAEQADPKAIESMVPKYEALTELMNGLIKKDG